MTEETPTTGRRWLERFPPETVGPLLTAYVLLCLLYAWQAWRRETPTIFTDEVELTQISRAIAETGQPARRGEAYGFTTLVPFFTAPAWRISSVATAYEAVKYLQVLVMATIPTVLYYASIALMILACCRTLSLGRISRTRSMSIWSMMEAASAGFMVS